eukprot:gb/GECH01002135.1/.p1 GENE.gb/GECH01002135.1/~~gb/GECH01002135.1/.p1  ORF type:complete len:607 (+),score=139.19 gb/GECH01002135.1/:1-1821(+)
MRSVYLYGVAFVAIAATLVVFQQVGNRYTYDKKAIENDFQDIKKHQRQNKNKKKQRQERARQKKAEREENQKQQQIKIQEKQLKSFSDDQIGINFNHPEHWECDIVKSQHPTRVLRFSNLEDKSNTKIKKEGFDAYIFLVMEEKTEMVDLNKFIKETKNSLQSSVSINLENEEDTVVKFEENGNVFELPAKIVTYTQGEGEMAVRAWSLFSAVGKRTICFQYLSKLDLFDSHTDDLSKTVASIRVFPPSVKDQQVIYHDRCFGIRMGLPSTLFSIENTGEQKSENYFRLLDACIHAHFAMTTPIHVKMVAIRKELSDEKNCLAWINSEIKNLFPEFKGSLERTSQLYEISISESNNIMGKRYSSSADVGRFDVLLFTNEGINFGLFVFSPRTVVPFVRGSIDQMFKSISIGSIYDSQYTILQDDDFHTEGLLEYLNPADKIQSLVPASTRIAVTSGFNEPLVSFCTYEMPLGQGYRPSVNNEEVEDNAFLESSITIKHMEDGAYLEDIKQMIETEREKTQKNNISVNIDEQEICEFRTANNSTKRGIKAVETHLHTQMTGISLKVLKAFILLDDNKIFNARCMAIPNRFDDNRQYFDEFLDNITIQ